MGNNFEFFDFCPDTSRRESTDDERDRDVGGLWFGSKVEFKWFTLFPSPSFCFSYFSLLFPNLFSFSFRTRSTATRKQLFIVVKKISALEYFNVKVFVDRHYLILRGAWCYQNDNVRTLKHTDAKMIWSDRNTYNSRRSNLFETSCNYAVCRSLFNRL